MTLTKYQVIGLMSGTSLDGLDLAFCTFQKRGPRWEYQITEAETIPYSPTWRTRLATLEQVPAFDFVATDIEYGHLLGRLAKAFMARHKLTPDFIASHGHTIFHQPSKKITSQIGRGSAIAAETGLPVVCDFRSLDVALGGQGAPLVPIGDHLLFGDFESCLNLGGFANISFVQNGKRTAFDICPANIVLNALAEKLGSPYDRDGLFARQGKVIYELLDPLNSLPYYSSPPPKSLGKEWAVDNIFPLTDAGGFSAHDLLATYCEHIAIQIASAIPGTRQHRVLVTGGGAFNRFLTERIRHHAIPEMVIPDNLTVNYKEALIFAFLGVLRQRNEINCLKSVTGASADSCGGAIY